MNWPSNSMDYPEVVFDENGNPIAERGQSWVPVDLEPFLNGTYERPTPTLGLARSDGLHLIYPGKEHTIIGEMESGKSWVCVACVVAEILNGRTVVYVHFEEADPGDTIDRLRDLGVPDDRIRKQFHFVGPNEPTTPTRMAALVDLAPALVVLDGVNEAMSMHTMGIRDEDGAAAFRRRLVKPFTAIGAATLAADHVVKDKDKRGRDPLGSIHKGNGLTGTLIMLENVDPFGRGERGASHVFVTKDRPGHLRRHGKPSRLPGKTFMGTLIVDDTRTWMPILDLAFLAPRVTTPEEEGADPEPTQRDKDDADVLAIVIEITELGKTANVRTIRAQSTFSSGRTDDAIERLLLRNAISETPGPRTSRVFTVTVPEDQPSDKGE